MINAAARLPQYKSLVEDAITYGKTFDPKERLSVVLDKLAVNFGLEILKLIPGYVSTEIDARLSFDTEGSISRAKRIISLYADKGIGKDRVLIKMASTWEGIKAAEFLVKEGIHTNMTLLFNFAQAIAAAEAGATLISPFVGRILDWHKKSSGKEFTPEEDPGVISVKRIYNYYKAHGHQTIVMGASFRSPGEVLALAGCDRLTISPAILSSLTGMTDAVPVKLTEEGAKNSVEATTKVSYSEASFRWAMNEDAMATEKLAEGIRGFAADLVKLEDYLKPLM